MRPSEELCQKFPSVLREKLLKGEIEFPEEVEFDYEKKLVFRAVERRADDYHEIDSNDFKSYYELKKKPKRMRQGQKDLEKNPKYYGVSSFLDRRIVEQKMKFPNPNKKMAVGYVYKEGGPQQTTIEDKHVCWWLYDKVQVHGFRIEDN